MSETKSNPKMINFTECHLDSNGSSETEGTMTKLQSAKSIPKLIQFQECHLDSNGSSELESTLSKTKLQSAKSSPKMIQFQECHLDCNGSSETDSTIIKKKLQRKKSNPNMIQFTESISAINSMSASVGLIRAKNAFLRKLSKDPISQEDIQQEGEKEWKMIEESYTPLLKWNDIDFTDLVDKNCENVEENPTVPKSHCPPPPPPPPPPSMTSTASRNENSAPCNLLFKDQPSKSHQSAKTSEKLPRKNEKENKLIKLHWKPIPKAKSMNTLWSQLPESMINAEQLRGFFQIKEKKLSSSDHQNKPKEVSVLDKKRSNQINIGTKNLPSLGSLKTIILKMDDSSMSRDGVEKLQSLIGSSEEITMIKEAQKNNPDIPLGHAEQFLLMLHSISSLECKLKLWAFKLDFEVMEEDITYPLKCLKEGIDRIKASKSFSLLMSYILAAGNVLNRTDCEGFQLEYLSKLKDVKDTETKKTLLHHIIRNILETEFEIKDLAQEFGDFRIVSRTNFEDLQINLESMEEECKRSMGYLKLAARYDTDTHQLVHDFLIGATERILTMKRIYKLVLQKHATFLDWFGIIKHLQVDYNPMKVATILVNFAMDVNYAKTQLMFDKNRKTKKKETEIVQVMKTYSGQSLKRKEKKKKCTESKSLDDGLLDEKESNSSLEEFLVTASASLTKTKARRTVSRQSSTASECRYSRTVARQSAVRE